MNVYMVSYINQIYVEEVVGVFSTREKAEEFCLTIPDSGNTSICEMELDRGYKQ